MVTMDEVVTVTTVVPVVPAVSVATMMDRFAPFPKSIYLFSKNNSHGKFVFAAAIGNLLESNFFFEHTRIFFLS